MQKSSDVCLSCPSVFMLTIPCLGESSRPPKLTTPSLTFVSPKCPPVNTSPVHKSPSHTSPVHTSPIHAFNVTVPVPLLVTARCSLLIYTSVALYVRNW